MIELTVKTLDSRNHNFSVPDDMTVKQLKEHIADSVSIPADSQRLIYCGRVLQDEKNLSEYDVNGKVIHLVQRAPPAPQSNNTDGGSVRNTASTNTRRNQPWRTLFQQAGTGGNAMYLGAMAFPADLMDAQGITMPEPRQCLSQSRLAVARNMLMKARNTLVNLENPTPPGSPTQETGSDTSPDANMNANVTANANLSGNGNISALNEAFGNVLQTQIAQAFVAAVSAAHNSDPQSLTPTTTRIEVVTRPHHISRSHDESRSTPAESTEGQSAQEGAASADQQQQNASGSSSSSGGRRYPRTVALAELIDLLQSNNRRLQPFLQQYYELVRDDPVLENSERQQLLFRRVSEVMHFLAHAYHALSDIICDFSLAPPRYLRCRPVLIQHSAVLQTGFPIQAHINLSANHANNQQTSGTATGGTNESSNGTTPTAPSAPVSQTETVQGSSETVPTTAVVVIDTNNSSSSSTNTSSQQGQIPRSQPQSSQTGGRTMTLPGFEFYMDVGPSSITIDSLEATVVTNANSNTSDANTGGGFSWGSQTAPPEFVQTLMQALAGQIIDGGSGGTRAQSVSTQSSTTAQNAASATPTPGQNSQARGNVGTHPTTATQTRSTSRPHVHLPHGIQGFGSSNFDPFLPCNSHHIHRYRVNMQQQQQQQQAQPQQQQNQAAGSQTQQEQSRPTASQPHMSRQLLDLLRLQQLYQERDRNFLTPVAETVVVTATSPEPPANIEVTPEAQQQPEQLPGEHGNIRFTIFSQLLQRLTGGAAQPTTTLADFLTNMPDYSYTAGESIFMDVFMTLAQRLTFVDMMDLGLGNPESLLRTRPHLQQFVSERLLQNEPLNDTTTARVVTRLNNELQPYYNILNNTRLREDIDVVATLNVYNHAVLPDIIRTVMEDDESTFANTLMEQCKKYIQQICAIVRYCCLDDIDGMESIVRRLVRQMTEGVPHPLQAWTMTSSVVNFRSYAGNLNVPVEDIQRFFVYRVGDTPSAPPQQPSPTPPPPPPQQLEPMETDSELAECAAVQPVEGAVSMDLPVNQSSERSNDVLWQNGLPQDWVPIITRDVQRQRRQNPQPPFSDAYLTGMPSKRRKLITSSKPQGSLSQVISQSMATALGAAGMGSAPEADIVAQRAGQDPTLQAAYRDQVRSTVKNNLQKHPDFTAEKYPNTAKYFGSPK